MSVRYGARRTVCWGIGSAVVGPVVGNSRASILLHPFKTRTRMAWHRPCSGLLSALLCSAISSTGEGITMGTGRLSAAGKRVVLGYPSMRCRVRTSRPSCGWRDAVHRVLRVRRAFFRNNQKCQLRSRAQDTRCRLSAPCPLQRNEAIIRQTAHSIAMAIWGTGWALPLSKPCHVRDNAGPMACRMCQTMRAIFLRRASPVIAQQKAQLFELG